MNKEIRAQKETTIKDVEEALKAAKSVTIVEYRGLTVKDLEELKKTLREQDSCFKVFKNTLVAIASKNVGLEELTEHLEGPNAFVFSNKDEVSAPKALVKFAKTNEKLVIKAGTVGNEYYDGAKMMEIAKLPSKEGLLSMFLSCLKAPMTKFAATVKAVADAKEN